MVNASNFPDTKIKVVFAVSYCRGKALEWIQPYIIKYIDKEWMKQLSQDT